MKLFKNIALILLSLAGFGSLTSCEKIHTGNGTIVPVVKGVSEGATKSGPVTIDDDKVYDEKPGANAEKLSVNGFIMDAWLESEGHDNETGNPVPVHFIDNAPVTHSSNWIISGDPKWVNGIATRFWCWNKLAMDSGLNTGLGYSETSNTRNFAFTVPTEATNRRDIVMAYTKKTWTESANDYVNLRFYHPLANICFILSDSFTANLDIVNIKLENVFTKGSFTYTGSGSENESSQTASFIWSDLSGENDILEVIDKANIRNVNFFIPEQSPTAETRLSVTFKRNDNTTVTRKVELLGNPVKWEAGHYYCYKIGATDALNQPIVFTLDLVSWNSYSETTGDLTLKY